MGIFIALSAAEGFVSAVVGIPQVSRNAYRLIGRRPCRMDAQGAVALGSGAYIGYGLTEVKQTFRHADLFHGGKGGLRLKQGHWVGKTHILRGVHHQPARHGAGVNAGAQHAAGPEKGGVAVRAA